MKKANIVILENNRPDLELLSAYVSEVFEQYKDTAVTLTSFIDPKSALEYIAQNDCDILFSDAELCGMDGLSLLHSIQQKNPKTNFVITTAYEEYVIQAVQMQIRLAGYLSLPITMPKMEKLISNILPQMKVVEAG